MNRECPLRQRIRRRSLQRHHVQLNYRLIVGGEHRTVRRQWHLGRPEFVGGAEIDG